MAIVIYYTICMIGLCILLSPIKYITHKDIKGCFGIRRWRYKENKEICMVFNIRLIMHLKLNNRKMEFKKQLLDYIDNMILKDTEYKVVTHDKILSLLSNVEFIQITSKSKYKKRVLFEKLLVLNFKNFFKKVQFYEVTIKRVK